MSDKSENLTIAVLISKASEKLRQEFEYIRETNIHNGEMGGETEEKVRDFLNRLMPADCANCSRLRKHVKMASFVKAAQ